MKFPQFISTKEKYPGCNPVILLARIINEKCDYMPLDQAINPEFP
jgi:hypothetical protein